MGEAPATDAVATVREKREVSFILYVCERIGCCVD